MSRGGWYFCRNLEYVLAFRIWLNEAIDLETIRDLNRTISITSAAELTGDFTLPLRPQSAFSRLYCIKNLSKRYGDSVTITNELIYYLLRSVFSLL